MFVFVRAVCWRQAAVPPRRISNILAAKPERRESTEAHRLKMMNTENLRGFTRHTGQEPDMANELRDMW